MSTTTQPEPLARAARSLSQNQDVEWLTRLIEACAPSFASLHGFKPLEQLLPGSHARPANFAGNEHIVTDVIQLASWSQNSDPPGGGIIRQEHYVLFVTRDGKLMLLHQIPAYDQENPDRRWELTYIEKHRQLEPHVTDDILNQARTSLANIARNAGAYHATGIETVRSMNAALGKFPLRDGF